MLNTYVSVSRCLNTRGYVQQILLSGVARGVSGRCKSSVPAHVTTLSSENHEVFSRDFKEVIVNCRICLVHANKMVTLFLAAAVEQWVIAFAPQAEGLVFESQLLQT